MGRPTSLTPEIQEKICDAIQIGATRIIAARAAGISERSFYYWIERGRVEQERLKAKGARQRKRELPFLQFLQALEVSEATGEVEHLEKIAAEGGAGSRWILVRRHPERWTQVNKQEITGKDGGPIESKDITMTDEERQEALDAFYRRVSDETGNRHDGGDDQPLS